MKQLLTLLFSLFLSIGVAFGAVNVNTATQAELETLNGIGPAKAKAIIDHRTKHGPFKSVEDLDKVPGIGEGTVGKMKSGVTFSGKTTVTAVEKSGTSKESGSKASTDKTGKTGKSDAKAVTSGKDEKSDKRKSTEEKSARAATKDSKAEAKDTNSDAKKKSATDGKKVGSAASMESKDAKGKSSKKDELKR
jgi:competence protein ComEA